MYHFTTVADEGIPLVGNKQYTTAPIVHSFVRLIQVYVVLLLLLLLVVVVAGTANWIQSGAWLVSTGNLHSDTRFH